MMMSANVIILSLLLLCAIVALQIFLSRRESKWPGLILPILTFLFSLSYPCFMILPQDGATAGFLFAVFLVWLMANIPTVVSLLIYFICRDRKKRKKQMDKMNIQDL